MINAPASIASSGIISGSGLANANINGSLFIDLIISLDNAPALDTPTNISLPLTASTNFPDILFLFVI
jgi:hypothetical protein